MQRRGVCVAWASSDWAAPACFPRRFASQVRNDDALALARREHCARSGLLLFVQIGTGPSGRRRLDQQ